jgi:putative membrane protein
METALVEKTSNELAQERTDLAFRRTVMAVDRTLMAWVRTGLSIISFGFTVYKLLDALQTRTEVIAPGITPQQVGMFLCGAGSAALTLGVIEYFVSIRQLRQEAPVGMLRSSLVIAVLIAGFGIYLVIGIHNHST